MAEGRMESLCEALSSHGVNPRLWMRRVQHTFAGIDLRGRRVLDVGSGLGWASYYAAAMGAERVVSVEPEADGSHGTMLETAAALRSELGLEDTVEIVPTTLEEAGLSEQFDVVVLINSINHMNEPACVVLDRSEDARSQFRDMLAPVRDSCAPGGRLVVTDCTNRNLFGDLGVKSPMCPTIEWEKHQPPKVWVSLLRELGFTEPRVTWTPHPRLGLFGPLLAAHPLLAYVFNSHFRLTMRRAG
ncbi:MAG: class I SAM-dependent methyltransferase [Tsuneonella sp.]